MMNKTKSLGISLLAASALILSTLMVSSTAHATKMLVHKTPLCGCCRLWVNHLEAEGFDVEIEDHENLTSVKATLGVPLSLQSCHTAIVGGYLIEGHVPVEDIRRLLEERPDAFGLAVPGMPLGSPGMEVDGRKQPYNVVLFSQNEQAVFAIH
jgi:hypothetical protein|tara:strand:- start:528 stop:986 length:459 start_codon:yes stop_codon:yes gene_type:complete